MSWIAGEVFEGSVCRGCTISARFGLVSFGRFAVILSCFRFTIFWMGLLPNRAAGLVWFATLSWLAGEALKVS